LDVFDLPCAVHDASVEITSPLLRVPGAIQATEALDRVEPPIDRCDLMLATLAIQFGFDLVADNNHRLSTK
jgi:hypothetical protein